jgi:hypothetical protein
MDNQETLTILGTQDLYLPVSLDYPLLIAPSLFSNAYLPVSLDCPFLIAPSVFSNDYLPVSLDCPFLIALRFSLIFNPETLVNKG